MEGRATGLKRALVFAIAMACGGDPGVQAPARQPPRAVLALQLRVNGGGGEDTFCPALENGLARSGMGIASDPQLPADAVIACHTSFSEDDSLFRVQVNGQMKMRITVRVEVRTPQNQLVDQFVAEYKGYRGGQADEDAIAKVVLAFAYSPRIAAFARIAKSGATNPAPTATVAEPVATQSAVDRRDDQEWFSIDTVKCKIPARVEACDAVRRYLQRRPDGAHAQEANAILTAAQPALEKLQKDDIAWQKSNRYECQSKRTSDACVGVEAYEIQFPTGMHSDEAHRLLKAAGVDK